MERKVNINVITYQSEKAYENIWLARELIPNAVDFIVPEEIQYISEKYSENILNIIWLFFELKYPYTEDWRENL